MRKFPKRLEEIEMPNLQLAYLDIETARDYKSDFGKFATRLPRVGLEHHHQSLLGARQETHSPR